MDGEIAPLARPLIALDQFIDRRRTATVIRVALLGVNPHSLERNRGVDSLLSRLFRRYFPING